MENRCVSCGAALPEGRQVCPDCEAAAQVRTYPKPTLNDPKERRKPWLFMRLRQMKAILLSCLTGKSNQR